MLSEKDKKENRKGIGRPSVMTEHVLDKILYACSIGCSMTECALYADISLDTLYKYRKNAPEFAERMDLLRNKPILKARENVIHALEGNDPIMTRWYLERKKADEFTIKHDVTVSDNLTVSIDERETALKTFLESFRSN